jgi:hypothetical protein
VAALAAFLAAFSFLPCSLPEAAVPDESSRAHLLRIYDEVKALGTRPGEYFFQQEFFIGGPDDDDTNKDIHVVVLIEPGLGTDKVTVQVTRLERDRKDRNVKTARETKMIKAEVVKAAVRNLVSDYEDRDLHETLEKIQVSILQKKALLKEKRRSV